MNFSRRFLPSMSLLCAFEAAAYPPLQAFRAWLKTVAPAA